MKIILKLIPVMLAVLTSGSCNRQSMEVSTQKLQHSEFLRFGQIQEGITTVEIINPWDTSKILHRYILIPKKQDISQETIRQFPQGTIVRTPIDSIVVYSSVHASIIETLGASGSIIGVCEPEYIVSPNLKKRIQAGEIADCGNSISPNIEKIIDCSAEVIIVSPFENSSYGAIGKLGLPIIEGADYMESTPLGRTEWIRFFGVLLDREAQADSLFARIRDNYRHLCSQVTGYLEHNGGDAARKTMISERRYGSSWDVPGADSYMVRVYEDAGAKYLFDDLSTNGSINMSFEKVFQRGSQADFWIFKYWKDSADPMTYQELRDEYDLYAQFKAFKEHKIYACNTAASSYYDDILLHPDAVLADLIYVFHPTILPEGFSPRYFLPLGISH